jgi:hypothetical protein
MDFLRYYTNFYFDCFNQHYFFTDNVAILSFGINHYNSPVVDLDFRSNFNILFKSVTSRSNSPVLLLNLIETNVVKIEDAIYKTVQAFVKFV